MTNRFELFKKMGNGLLSYTLEAFFNDSTGKKTPNALAAIAIVVGIILLVVLFYAGAEAVFLLTRTNFGTKGVKKLRAVLASLAFMVLAYFCYNCFKKYYGQIMDFGSEASFGYAALTFLFVGVIVFIKAITAGGKDDSDVIDPIYRGDSWLLGGLVKDGIKQSTVQDVAEPMLFFALGFFLFSYNYIWGLPFMFCAISCWFHLAVEAVAGFFRERQQLSNEGLVYTQNRRTAQTIS